MKEFGGRREANKYIIIDKIFKLRFIGKYLISRDYYIILLNLILKKIIIFKSNIILKVYNLLEDLPI